MFSNKILALTIILIVSVLGLTVFSLTACAEPANTYVYVSNLNSGTISVIDALTLSRATDIKTDVGPSDVIVNPAGTILYVAYDKSPYIDAFSTTDYTLIKRILVSANASGWTYTRMAMNDAGTKLYVTMYGDASVYILDTVSNTVTLQKYMVNDTSGSPRKPYGITYHNGYVYVSIFSDPGNNGLVWKLDANNLSTLKDYGYAFRGPSDIEYDSVNIRLLVCNNNGTITLINTTTDAVDGMLTYPGAAISTGSGASVNASGYTYRAIPSTYNITVYNPAKAIIANITLPTGPTDVICNNYNNTAFVAGYGDGHLYVIDTNNNTITASGYIGNGPYRISMGTQAYPVTHQVKFVIQSLYGLFKYDNVSVAVYDNNGVLQYSKNTDTSGQAVFYLQPTVSYTVWANSTADSINETITVTPYDSIYYFNVWSFFSGWNPFGWMQGANSSWTGAGTGNVNKDIGMNYSLNLTASPRIVLLNYSDATLSTTAINFTLLQWQDNGTYLVYNTTIVNGAAIGYYQMSMTVPDADADGHSFQVVVTATTTAYGAVKRMDSIHFPGVAYPMPGLPLSWYPYIAFGVIILFGLFFTYLSSGLGLIVMAAWGIIFMFMGWLAWSNAFMLLLNVLAVFGVAQIFKMKKQREGV